MTTEKAKHLSEVLKAYSEGKTIEYRVLSSYGFWGEWDEWSGSSAFNEATNYDQPIEYRIKPESALRPYANAREFMKAMKEHGPYYHQIDMVDTDFFMMPTGVTNFGFTPYNGTVCNYERFCKMYEWQDGSPCGIEECEEKQEE